MMKRPLLLVVIAIAAVGLDQLIKYLVETGMEMHERIELLPVLSLFRIHNTGIAFSMLAGLGPIELAGLAAVVLIAVLWLWVKTPPDRKLTHFALAIVVGGAIGNLIDRLVLGYVVDYVYFHTPVWSFAVFNLADSFISVGAFLIVIDEFLLAPRKQAALSRKGSPSERN